MTDLDPHDDTDGMVFRDVIMLTLMGFVTMVVLMIPHLNPPAAEAEARPPGSVIVEARWPDGVAADVDLWVAGPDGVPVGYSNRSGEVFDLLRDDLGARNDLTDLNYEFAFSRGAPAGAYAVTVHLYNSGGAPLPLSVEVTVSMRDPASGRLTRIARERIELARAGQEETVARFRLNDSAGVVAGSLTRLPINLHGSGR